MSRRSASGIPLILSVILVTLGSGCDQPQRESALTALDLRADLRMNQLQTKGTHNSYHIQPRPKTIPHWSYTHLPLDRQLDEQGVRQIELDINYNAETGGFDVFHVRLVDSKTTCKTLQACLKTAKGWSDVHPRHVPIMVMIEPKAELTALEGVDGFALLESSILEILPRGQIVTPDEVRGDAPTLLDAVRTRGWPRLDEVRGRFVFMLLASNAERQAYTDGEQDPTGRLLFVDGDVGKPYAVLITIDDPRKRDEIHAAVRLGLIVRTRADTDSEEALNNDFSRLEAALTSGAHYISTDYPAKVPTSDYVVEIPDGPVRCNPISAHYLCRSSWFD
ncbi:MAG: hypothetical protein KC609_04905 [Myxococcales bacterium]|nr:hypothetical protein [Myxococcales bacterium]